MKKHDLLAEGASIAGDLYDWAATVHGRICDDGTVTWDDIAEAVGYVSGNAIREAVRRRLQSQKQAYDDRTRTLANQKSSVRHARKVLRDAPAEEVERLISDLPAERRTEIARAVSAASRPTGWDDKARAARESQRADRLERLGLRFVELDQRLGRAKAELVAAVNLAHAADWGDEERELLTEAVANVRALIGLIDVALVGAADVDWDKELASLVEES